MSSEEIDSLKTNPAVLRLYGQKISLRRENGKLIGLCPFHSEKSGSFTIFEKDCLYKCFGCGASGNIMQFVQKMENCDFKTAVAKVRDFVGENNWAKDAERVDATFRPAVESQKTFKTYTLAEYASFEKALAQNQDALGWLLRERGITAETAKKLHLGYRRDVGRLAGEKNADIADKGWVAFPCIEDGKVVSLKYRSVARKSFCKQPGMASALFNTESIDLFAPVMLVEGELDAAVLVQAGFNAVSLQSASTYPTPSQKDQLMRAESVILAGDNDGAVGSSVMEKLWRELAERTYLLRWPVGTKDANQFFLETCKRDPGVFKTKVSALIQQAKTQPAPDVYSIQEVLRSGKQTHLVDHPQRFHFPWPSVDKMAIIIPGHVVCVMATSTGMGKSAWTIEATLHECRKYRKTVINYQCEMSAEEIAVMVAANVLKKDRNHLSAEEMKEAADQLEGVQYYVGYNPNLSRVGEVLDLIEAAIRRLGCGVCVLDHLHHVCRNEENEVKAQADAMQRIKRLAVQYQCVFFVVGQPRKANQQSKGKLVHLSDGKGSETFSSDANAFFALHRDLAKNSDPDIPQKDTYEPTTHVHLLKARTKGEGNAVAKLLFIGELATFSEIDYAHEDPYGTA